MPAALLCSFTYALYVPSIISSHGNRGLYGKEYSPQDGDFVWTAQRAQLMLCSSEGRPVKLEIKAAKSRSFCQTLDSCDFKKELPRKAGSATISAQRTSLDRGKYPPWQF